MEFQESAPEKKEEKAVFRSDLKVDFIRHGKPEYTAEERKTAKYEGNLTEEGTARIKDQALKLAQQIDKEKELVVFWVSPRKRAWQSAEILYKVFQEQGITVIKDLKTVLSLSDVKMSSGFIEDLLKNKAMKSWMEYWAESNLPEGTEKPEEVKKRVKRVVTYLERIARQIAPQENKRLHFICVGHEEIFRDILEEGYGLGTKDKTGPSYGEVMSMDIGKSEQGKEAVLKLKYREQEADLSFDKKSREFHKQEN